LSINGKRKYFTLEDLLTLAKAMNIKKPKQIIDEVEIGVKRWPEFAKQTGVSERLRSLISGNLVSL